MSDYLFLSVSKYSSSLRNLHLCLGLYRVSVSLLYPVLYRRLFLFSVY